LEHSVENLKKCSHAGAKKVLEATLYLHVITHVLKNIEWYILDGSVSIEAATALPAEVDLAVKAFIPYMNTALDSLGLPKVADLYGPIARDYVAFNA